MAATGVRLPLARCRPTTQTAAPTVSASACSSSRRRPRDGVGRAGSTGRGARLLDARRCPTTSTISSLPCPRCSARPTPPPRCGSVHWCSTTTTSIRWCSPRSWRRWTCCPTDGSRSASAPDGWPPTTNSRASRTTRPASRIDRFVEGLADHQGRMGAGAVLVRRRALHDHRLRRSPKPVQSPCPPILIGGGGKRVLRSPPARPTSSGSTARCTSGVIGPKAFATMTAEAVDEKVAIVADAAAAAGRLDDIEMNIRTFLVHRHRRHRTGAADTGRLHRGRRPAMIETLAVRAGRQRRRRSSTTCSSAASGAASASSPSARRRRGVRPRRRPPRRHLNDSRRRLSVPRSRPFSITTTPRR